MGELTEALKAAWGMLLEMPVSIDDPEASQLAPALEAVLDLHDLIEMQAQDNAIATAMTNVSTAMVALSMADSKEVRAVVRKIRDKVLDAGSDIKDW
ncbi:hypothetical protein [Trinickia dinghuensis]|uniref:Uncharacterized protein n=1 Tax=Trinickia dinghuensis TaxID=2291023 RepID=A0A3D8JN80_9BURK|nr:hypothetical protein [Trinickia dinghuensis]RDU94569.1 hypothetical protein DWV00_33360 [Trinickia dinghuensis]